MRCTLEYGNTTTHPFHLYSMYTNNYEIVVKIKLAQIMKEHAVNSTFRLFDTNVPRAQPKSKSELEFYLLPWGLEGQMSRMGRAIGHLSAPSQQQVQQQTAIIRVCMWLYARTYPNIAAVPLDLVLMCLSTQSNCSLIG